MSKTTRTTSDAIPCPNCKKLIRDLWDYDFANDCTEIECSWGCGAIISLTRHVSVSYTGTLLRVEKAEDEKI